MRAVNRSMVTVDGYSRGTTLSSGMQARSIAQSDLVRAELVQAFKSKEASFIAHFNQALQASIGACRGLELESPRKHFRLTFYYGRAEVAQDMSVSVGVNNYTDAFEILMYQGLRRTGTIQKYVDGGRVW